MVTARFPVSKPANTKIHVMNFSNNNNNNNKSTCHGVTLKGKHKTMASLYTDNIKGVRTKMALNTPLDLC